MFTFDPAANLVYVDVNTTQAAGSTSLVLAAGEGLKMPDPAVVGAYNGVIYDALNYPNPTDDPNVEIERVTALSTDTLTVTRAQEGTSDVNHTTAGGQYKFYVPLTKAMYDALTAAIKTSYGAGGSYSTTGGSATVYTATVDSVDSYYQGDLLKLNFHAANTGTAPTINVNSLGAKTIKRADGGALVAGDIPINKRCFLLYDGTDMLLMDPAQLFPVGLSGGQTLIGGTAAGDDLTFQTTAGNGSGDTFIFKRGNNGATTAAILSATGLDLAASTLLSFGGVTIITDTAGTTTLANIDAVDATTEATIEAAIDTLANLTSIQGHTFTLAGDFSTSGANALTLTTTGATNVTLPTAGTLATLAGAEEFTNKTLNASVGKGTWTASGTWQLPAWTMGGNVQMLENVSLMLDAALSADGKYSGITEAGTLGETVAFGEIVYLKAADSQWYKTDADADSTAGAVRIAVCVLAGNDNDPTVLLTYGKVRADSLFPALTIGAPVYISTTPGAVQTAQPSGTDDVIRIVGHANTADELFFSPSNDYITHT